MVRLLQPRHERLQCGGGGGGRAGRHGHAVAAKEHHCALQASQPDQLW